MMTEGSRVLQVDPRVQLLLDPLDGLVSTTIRDQGVWEPQITEAIRSLLRPEDVFADVGAHIGYYACLGASWVGRGGLVLAFEPNARSYAFLERNVVLNDQRVHPGAGGQGPQADVRTFPIALWDQECLLPFSPGLLGNTGAARVIADDEPSTDLFHVEGVRNVLGLRLDTLLDLLGLPGPDVLKIDVERAEGRVLHGASWALQGARAVVLEWAGGLEDSLSMRNKAQSYACLRDAGFSSFTLLESGQGGLRHQDLMALQGNLLVQR